MAELKEPEGISFFDVKTGDTHYCKLEPTLAAYINSSDMGINASRDQDFGWKLGKEWVEKVRKFRRDRTQMQMLSREHGGQKPTTVQILYWIYSEELRAYQENLDENENPFEGQYQRDIAEKPKKTTRATITSDDELEDADTVPDTKQK